MLNVKANPIYTKPIKYSPSIISQIPNPTSNKDNTIEIFDNSFKYFINYDLFLFLIILFIHINIINKITIIKSFTYSVNTDNIKNITDETKNNISSLFKFITLIYLMSVWNESKTYLRRLEVAELKEEDMPMVFNMKKQYQLLSFLELVL